MISVCPDGLGLDGAVAATPLTSPNRARDFAPVHRSDPAPVAMEFYQTGSENFEHELSGSKALIPNCGVPISDGIEHTQISKNLGMGNRAEVRRRIGDEIQIETWVRSSEFCYNTHDTGPTPSSLTHLQTLTAGPPRSTALAHRATLHAQSLQVTDRWVLLCSLGPSRGPATRCPPTR